MSPPPGPGALPAPCLVSFASTQAVLKGEDVLLVRPRNRFPGAHAPRNDSAGSSSADSTGHGAMAYATYATTLSLDGAANSSGELESEQALIPEVSAELRCSGSVEATSRHYGVYCVFDGHNGRAAAQHCTDTFMDALSQRLPPGPAPPPPTADSGAESAAREAWRHGIQRALAAAFAVVQHTFAGLGEAGGSTATCIVQAGWLVTCANVGDSLGLIDTGWETLPLTADHRVADSPSEQARVRALGGTITNVHITGRGPAPDPHAGLGPLRIWPGGVANARAVGDFDVGGLLLAVPHITQIEVPPGCGARCIIASDGVWDAFDIHKVAKIARRCAAAEAAQRVVAILLRAQGCLRDDTSLIVLDLLPPGMQFPDCVRAFGGGGGGGMFAGSGIGGGSSGGAAGGGKGCCCAAPSPVKDDEPSGPASHASHNHAASSAHRGNASLAWDADITVRPKPRLRVAASLDVAGVLGLLPDAQAELPPGWQDPSLLAGLKDTQAEALAVWRTARAARHQGLTPSRSLGGSQSLLDYFSSEAAQAAAAAGPDSELGLLSKEGVSVSACYSERGPEVPFLPAAPATPDGQPGAARAALESPESPKSPSALHAAEAAHSSVVECGQQRRLRVSAESLRLVPIVSLASVPERAVPGGSSPRSSASRSSSFSSRRSTRSMCAVPAPFEVMPTALQLELPAGAAA